MAKGGKGGGGSSVFVQKQILVFFLYFYILEMDESLDLSDIEESIHYMIPT